MISGSRRPSAAECVQIEAVLRTRLVLEGPAEREAWIYLPRPRTALVCRELLWSIVRQIAISILIDVGDIVTTAGAVIFYVKAEEYKTGQADVQRELDNLATGSEINALPSTVGAKSGGETYLGVLLGYVDQTTTMIVGGVPAPDSAEIKIDGAGKALQDAVK